jgi:predicted enzyme related to lactoylglutathione lyase
VSDYSAQHNRVVWLDIPVKDLERACGFYRAVLAIQVHKDAFEGGEFAVLEHKEGNGGCLVPDPDKVTGEAGPLVYLNVEGRIRDAVAQVAAHGGQVTAPIHAIGPHGHRALILDSEGNRLALHSSVDA